MAKELQKAESPVSGDVEFREETREGLFSSSNASSDVEDMFKRDLNITDDDLLEAKEVAATLSLPDVRKMMNQVYKIYGRDPNFPLVVIEKIEAFIGTFIPSHPINLYSYPAGNEDIFINPNKHQQTIQEIKIQAALITNNSPYSEVRAVVDNRDDPSMPCSTIRAWFMGLIFSAAIAFVNGFFEMRQPPIGVSSMVPQLLAYPFGKFLEKTLPDVGFAAFGVRHSLNPGPFNRKEHMLITIMASISVGAPYTNYIAWIQYLPFFFNQPWANSIGYQILLGLSANFIGYGLAGLCRRFLVYPSYCVWPSSLATVALNTAFHGETNSPVLGPFKRIWHMSRLKFFSIASAAMFCYFWLPNYVFAGLTWFSWMTWIAPDNRNLAIITGGYTGLGLNPLSTLDWNVATTMVNPLVIPIHTTMNVLVGALLSFCVLVGVYYGNAYSTAYLPVNSNRVFDHFGGLYNVSSILDHRGLFDAEKYEAYSPAFLSASNYIIYLFFFAVYAAAITYGILYHHQHIAMGFRDLINSFRPSKKHEFEADQVLDVHNRLMKSYREVPEWWFMVCLAFALIVGIVAITQWPTHTSPAVVPFGVILTLIFIVPIGIISATTGIEVPLNVLSEFLGGSFVEGNALSLSLFKAFGYTTCTHALHFSIDMKLAHYLKLPPRFTFWAQMVPTFVSTFVYVGILQYQMHLENICTPNAPYRFTCPSLSSFFTSAVLWGTIGPRKLFGPGGQYVETLVGFPVGVLVVVIFWWLGKKYPKNRIIRSTHPVVLLKGGHVWAPYNIGYLLPAVPIAWFSWMYIKKRYLGLWAKYNYILAAAFSIGIALSALLTFFTLQYNDINLDWWGNRVPFQGCDGTGQCVLKSLLPGEYFGPRIGEFH